MNTNLPFYSVYADDNSVLKCNNYAIDWMRYVCGKVLHLYVRNPYSRNNMIINL